MRRYILAIMLISMTGSAQIGIATTAPTAMLDVNGSVRIRTTSSNDRESVAKDSILVADKVGNIQRISAKMVVNSALKTFIKGIFSGSEQNFTMNSSGNAKIAFNAEEFDENNEYNTSTNTFTAKSSGIYSINLQVKTTSAISVTPNLGVAILKNNNVIARAGFANVGVTIAFITLNVTPPIRTIQTLVKLDVGDTIKFNLYSDLSLVSLLSTQEDSFFTIQQVR